MRRHYKDKVSGYKEWDQLNHADDYLLYPDNIGENISIDEVSLSKGELYTYVTNKAGKGKKNTIIACIKGTKSQDIIDVLNKIPLEKRKMVKEITLDMANNMQLAARMSFPESYLVTDRFHVVKLVMEALQHQRIKYRWEEIENENLALKIAKEKNVKYIPVVHENGDTPKQLLVRSRYIIAKKPIEWTYNQKIRAQLLFKEYPLLHQTYKHTLEFRNIYEQTDKDIARQKFKEWIQKTQQLEINVFNIASNSLSYHLETILDSIHKCNFW